MRILVTRPKAAGERLGLLLRGIGHEVIVSPVIEIASTGRRPEIGRAEALLATSANAFGAALSGPAMAALRRLPIFVVGERTAAAAVRCGFQAPAVTAPDARSLVATLAGPPSPPQRFLYLAGVRRKPDLEAGLRALGRQVDVCEVYDARPAHALSPEAQQALRQGEVDAVMHLSPRSAAIFCDLARAAGLAAEVRAPLHLCISQDAARGLAALEPPAIRVAARPDLGGMLALLAGG